MTTSGLPKILHGSHRRRSLLRATAVAMLAYACGGTAKANPGKKQTRLPDPPREFRGVWVASVANIDWPSKPGLPVAQQQTELVAILDKCAQLKLNAVIFQVRPACDALYASKLEPWSEYLSGQMGKAPEPFYDPLAMAVKEAHKRGLELHAWFNPYRARHVEKHGPVSADHVSVKHPELVKQYGRYLWLDPGMEAVQDYTVSVVMDVVKRYDIDGVHIDDYFYPYKESDSKKQIIPFPDDASYQEYLKGGGTLGREDWRRENVNTLVERLYKSIKKSKPWVKFGISPFGIWRPGNPQVIKGYDPYDQLYADSKKWLQNGWCDYFSPQLYWPIKQTAQSYTTLLKWWLDQNTNNRHIWPGIFTSRVADGSKTAWDKDEIVQQVLATRPLEQNAGNVHFSLKPLMSNRGGIADALTTLAYTDSALIPACPWLHEHAPAKPKATLEKDSSIGGWKLSFKMKPVKTGTPDTAWLWLIQTKNRGEWQTKILPGLTASLPLDDIDPNDPNTVIAVTAVDRYGFRSAPAMASP